MKLLLLAVIALTACGGPTEPDPKPKHCHNEHPCDSTKALTPTR